MSGQPAPQRYFQVPYTNLVHSMFGSPPLAKVAKICQKLTGDGVLNASGDGGLPPHWSDYAVNPSQMAATGSMAFEPLVAVIARIFSQIPNCRFTCSMNPHAEFFSKDATVTCPDAYVRCPSVEKTYSFDIVVPFQFKKSNRFDGEAQDVWEDNERKMIRTLHNLMHGDPLRRFILGITIEDARMRIWHYSRALLTVSEPINFVTAIYEVISLFYLIGSNTKVELGWNPTIERVIVDREIQYKFTIGGQIFITTRLISAIGAEVMVGNGTRIYEARDENGKIVAIKDSWRDDRLEPEGKNLEKIFKDIEAKFGEKEAAEAKRYFVRVRAYEDVTISGETDTTLNPGQDGEWVDIGSWC